MNPTPTPPNSPPRSRWLFLLIGLVLGVALSIAATRTYDPDWFVPTYRLKIYAPSFAGLKPRAPVSVAGLAVGKVVSIRPTNPSDSSPSDPNRKFEITLRIRKEHQHLIGAASTAFLDTDSLLGPQLVLIQPDVDGQPLQDGATLNFTPTEEVTFDKIISTLENLREFCRSVPDPASGTNRALPKSTQETR